MEKKIKIYECFQQFPPFAKGGQVLNRLEASDLLTNQRFIIIFYVCAYYVKQI